MASQSRIEDYETISRNFVESWNNGIDADIPVFLRQFAPSIEWYDHAFFLKRKGLEELAIFRRQWLTAIQDFRCDIKSIKLVEGGTVIPCVYHGTMVGPLPNRKASRRTFAANVLIMLEINKEGTIQRVDEYYSATLDEAGDVETYTTMQSPKRGSGKL